MRGYRRGQQGAILVLTAFLLPFIIAFTGLAVDAGNAYVHHSKMQNSVDAAALAAGYKYAEKQNETDTKNKVDEYMKLNQGDDSYTIESIVYKKIDNNHEKITVTTSQVLPTYFLGPAMKLLSHNNNNKDADKWDINTKASVLVELNKKEDDPIGIFDYTMLGGHVGKADGRWNNKTLDFNTDNVTIKGKVHSNGPVAVASNHNTKIESFSHNSTSDAELWGNYDNSNGSHHYDYSTGTWKHDPGYENDEYAKSPWWDGYEWRHYRRLATLDDKDYTANNSKPTYVDISLSDSNPLTKNLSKIIGEYIDMDSDKQLKNHIYTNISKWDYWMWKLAGFIGISPSFKTYTELIHGNGKTEYPGLVFQGSTYNNPEYYRVIIVSGDLTVKMSNMPEFKNDSEHMLLVSLFGNVTVTDDGKNAFYGNIYAPNGNVSLGGVSKVYGSIVADKITVTMPGSIFEHRTFEDGSSSDITSDGSGSVSLVSDD